MKAPINPFDQRHYYRSSHRQIVAALAQIQLDPFDREWYANVSPHARPHVCERMAAVREMWRLPRMALVGMLRQHGVTGPLDQSSHFRLAWRVAIIRRAAE
jgi:hypothetical protein